MHESDTGAASEGARERSEELRVALVGDGERSSLVVSMLEGVPGVTVVAQLDRGTGAPVAAPSAVRPGLISAADVAELYRASGADVVLDLSEDAALAYELESQRPPGVALVTGSGARLVERLLSSGLGARDQSGVVKELREAYERIRNHERRLQASKEALERANAELENRLAEIFFTHEFFKALTAYTSVDDVTSLIVDGANGILGAEISAVYLRDAETGTLRLRAFQGGPEEMFAPEVADGETIVGEAVREGIAEEPDADPSSPLLGWANPAYAVRSHAAVALRSGEKVIGVLLIASAEKRQLVPAERERFLVIGNQSSLALQNALLHEELERLSVTDRLTELYNHGYLHRRLDEELERAARFGHRLSLIMLDLDDFKRFNDRYGHPAGDAVLEAVSDVIRQNLREIDVAARYGGEEFMIILPETDLVGAMLVAERVRRSMAERKHVPVPGEAPVSQTISLGVASYPEHGLEARELIEAADRAMYHAKRLGKNRVSAAPGKE